MEDRLTAILSIIETTADRWSALAGQVPEHLIKRKPLPGEWSALECLHHLISTEKYVFPVRTLRFLGGEDLPGYDPDKEEGPLDQSANAVEMAAEFSRLRDKSLDTLRKLAPGDLERSSVHEQLGKVTLDEMLHEWAAHDLNHTIQAEQAIMQPFIAGSGPWDEFFTAHDLSRRT